MADFVVEMANKNQSWGYTRIRDALHNPGITVDRNTVKRILNDHGIELAPERKRTGTSWKTFLAAHWDVLTAIDFFNVEVLTFTGIIRYYVLFAMRLETREVKIVGITAQPCEFWMKQMARNRTNPVDGFLRDTRYLIMDRDPLFTTYFRRMLKDSGMKLVRLPAGSPNLNAFAERFVLSIKSECLNKIIPSESNIFVSRSGSIWNTTALSETIRDWIAASLLQMTMWEEAKAISEQCLASAATLTTTIARRPEVLNFFFVVFGGSPNTVGNGLTPSSKASIFTPCIIRYSCILP